MAYREMLNWFTLRVKEVEEYGSNFGEGENTNITTYIVEWQMFKGCLFTNQNFQTHERDASMML